MTKIRLDLGWSKQKLSFRSEISPSDIGRFESGRLKPYDNQLRRMALALGIDEAKARSLLEEV